MQKINTLKELKNFARNEFGVEVSVRLCNGAVAVKTVKYFEKPLPATNNIWGDGYQTDVFCKSDYVPMGSGRLGLEVKWSVRHDSADCESEHSCDQSLDSMTSIVTAINEGSLFLNEV